MTSDRQPAPTAPGICTPGAILAGGEIRARARTAWACRVNQAHAMLERGGRDDARGRINAACRQRQ